jgi:uncharacterized membrane protein
MEHYLVLKYFHVLFAFVLVGTGFGIAFFQWMVWRSNNVQAIAVITKTVVLADWIFTFPAVLGQLVTGLLLMQQLHLSLESLWFKCVVALFIFIGSCWVPVVVIQYQLKRLANEALSTQQLSTQFYQLMRWWILLGCCAFSAILILVWLMVAKPLSLG